MYQEPDIVRRENINIPSLGVSDYSIEFRRLEIKQTQENLQYLLCFYDKKYKPISVVLREMQHHLKEIEI
ncbi:MAG: hypothetical protein LBG59_09950 [Candidatus Peribacteria bacterium]|jgi:hypothetical protein|nr:hypothetical protein [Candidatus Peribacteria bacterium]